MKRTLAIILWAMTFSAIAQTPAENKATKIIARIVGQWELTRIYDSKNKEMDSSRRKHPEAMRKVEFTLDAKYISKSPKLDSGYFRTNEDHQRIFLENSGTSNPDPREWMVDVGSDTLVLTSMRQPRGKQFKYVYKRNTPENEKASQKAR